MIGENLQGAVGRHVPVLTAREAVEKIPSNSLVSISSSSALGCPDFVLAALGQRFQESAEPKNLTFISPIAAGDMYGVKGIDHVSQVGLISKIMAGSYPSGPSSMEPPKIRQLIDQNLIQAWNLPSGVLFQMHRAGAAKQPGVTTKVGLDTFIDPKREGGAMNSVTPTDLVVHRSEDGEDYLFYPAIRPHVTILRATTADEHGNLTFEHEGSPLGALDQAYAAHNNGGLVIAQVKRVVKFGELHPRDVRVPGILIDAIVLDPNQRQTTMTDYDPALSGDKVENPILPEPEHNLETAIAVRAAQFLSPGWTVNLGFGISALVPSILSGEEIGASLTWVIEQGAVGGTPLTGFAFGCARNPDAIVQSVDQFTLLQGGGFNAALLSFLEVDQFGNVNVSHLPSRTHVTAGVGGFADIISNAPMLVFSGYFNAGKKNLELAQSELKINLDGSIPKFVKHVSQVTFSGSRSLELGQKVFYVTERCVLELRKEGLTVIEIIHGVDLQKDVLEKADFPLLVSKDLKTVGLLNRFEALHV
jgi:acyl CoA:acetate/3-ketoacid CoA transferase